ncbi:MAG: hypothetical protein M0R32_11265 [Candidatus Cloacimonetes bacterium]|jgi:hypothetical protein|nr:hypothetical protein [Candidatus Cloacimonadota bacterium]
MNQKIFSIPANWRRNKTAYLDPTQKGALDQHREEMLKSMNPEEREKHEELERRLLLLGGVRVCSTWEEDIDQILARAEAYKGTKSRRQKGRPCRCHQNSAALWRKNQYRMRIATGWALSRDGIWRQHSWVVELLVNWDSSGYQIIETTERRLVYYGFVMDSDECHEFDIKNCGF